MPAGLAAYPYPKTTLGTTGSGKHDPAGSNLACHRESPMIIASCLAIAR